MKTIIVAGITRSGLTVTMQMLQAGGYPCFGEYPAFENHELGKIPFKELHGKAIKVVDTHRQFPPPGDYYVIRLRRNYTQQAKSICKFINLFTTVLPNTRKAIREIERQLPKEYLKIDAWAKKQTAVMTLDFENIILSTKQSAEKIKEFTGESLDIEKMCGVVFKRETDCYPTMLEAQFV